MRKLWAAHVSGAVVPGTAVLVVSPLLLNAQAVSAALRGRGVAAEPADWVEGVRRARQTLTDRDTVLMLHDLNDLGEVMAAQDLISHSQARFLVLTSRDEGPAWGALLAGGAAGMMPADSSLDDVQAALVRTGQGLPVLTETRRSRLVREWFRWQDENDDLRRRLGTLSPRERDILARLSAGSSVKDVAAALGIAETTVRGHIKSLRRKLGAGSVLTAVAAAHRLGSLLLAVAGGPCASTEGRQHDESELVRH